MNPEEQKQEAELILFKEFQRVAPDLSLAEVSQPRPPAPDILGRRENRQIGVEITRFLRDVEKRQESEQERCLKAAEQEYRIAGHPQVGVSILWSNSKNIPRRETTALAKMLSDFVADNVPTVGGFHQLEPLFPMVLAEYVDIVSIERFAYEGAHLWNCMRAGWFPTLTPEELQNTIKAKEHNIEGYRAFCEELWLLIVSEGDPSSFIELSQGTTDHQYLTGFDRVFFLNSVPRLATELKVRAV